MSRELTVYPVFGSFRLKRGFKFELPALFLSVDMPAKLRKAGF
jgi:hypothetical protein